MGTVDGTCAGQVGIDFAPCFVALFPKPFRIVYSGSVVLEVSLGTFQRCEYSKDYCSHEPCLLFPLRHCKLICHSFNAFIFPTGKMGNVPYHKSS